MLQILDREKQLSERVLTQQPTARIERIKAAQFERQPTLSIDRARIETRVMKETEGEPMITRRSKVFAAIAGELPQTISPHELIVGGVGIGPACASVRVDNPMIGDLFKKREGSGPSRRDSLSDEDIVELQEELVPYWRGTEGTWEKTRPGWNFKQYTPEIRNTLFVDADANLFDYLKGEGTDGSIVGATTQHYGHNTVDYKKVLEKGFLGIRKEAEDRLSRIDTNDPEDAAKIPFLEAVIRTMTAAAEVGPRLAGMARALSERETDSVRKDELLKIADICDRVPAHPARTFHEALQTYWLAWVMLYWEESVLPGECHGRADQYLYPYYEKDLSEGRITEKRAQELIDCLILKINENSSSSHISVGGVKPNGRDATNALSYMFIEGMVHTRCVQPFFSIQVHQRMADDLLIKACRHSALGTGHPQFINADVMIDQALARNCMGGPPVTLEEARSATPVGCEELVIPGKDSGYGFWGARSILPAALEYVLTNGVNRLYGRKVGIETGDPRQFTSFEDFQNAYRRQFAWIRENRNAKAFIEERTLAELSPTAYASALIDDCIEEGLSREDGGARFQTHGVTGAGTSDAGDSLTAIKKLVFEDKTITMDELCRALSDNFEGHDEIYRMCCEAPKFGNDDDYADEQTAFVCNVFASELEKQRSPLGAKVCANLSPMAGYVPLGRPVGALPSGRLAGTPLCDSMSPCAGTDLKGPTAVLKSVGKIDNVEILGGGILNLRLDPAIFDSENGEKALADLIRTFIDQKIYHIQINIVSTETLEAAQREPEQYQTLMVKVAGFNAYFTRLNKALQDSIIARTEHQL